MNRQYRSFRSDLEALELNKLVVLTGKNGAGKSQLLQLLEGRQYIDKHDPQGSAVIEVDGSRIASEDIIGIFDWNMPSAPNAGMADLQNVSQEIVNHVVKAMNGERLNSQSAGMFSHIQRVELSQIATDMAQRGYNGRDNLPPIDVVLPLLSEEFSKKSAQIINERIARIIYDWHFTAFENNTPTDVPTNPVKVFNGLCEEFETGYHLPNLDRTSLRRAYVPQLINEQGDRVNWNELSSGEQVLFRVICWLFYHQTQQAVYPKLILMDEPDAHLTPKMIRRFMNSMQSTLVDKIGVAVIMTSHSPNTVALCDEQSIYELVVDSDGSRSIDKISRRSALQKFSEGLLFVQEDTRLVFVEGKDDVPFYENLLQIAISKHDLDTIPTMKFIAASTANGDHGGSSKVIEMVPRFAGTDIESLVFGLIDSDNQNEAHDNILVLNRYTIENYLYDPFLVAVLLIHKNKHRDLLTTCAQLDAGDYGRLISDATFRQSVVDEITNALYDTAKSVIDAAGHGSDPIAVSWRVKNNDTDIEFTLPKWFVKAKKSDLLQKIIRHRSSPFKDLLSDNDQFLAIEITGAIPNDILDIFHNIHGDQQ